MAKDDSKKRLSTQLALWGILMIAAATALFGFAPGRNRRGKRATRFNWLPSS